MAASPGLKIYNAKGEYIASVKHGEDAAALAAFNGPGTTIRLGHPRSTSVWIEGVTGNASESYDAVAETIAEARGELERAS